MANGVVDALKDAWLESPAHKAAEALGVAADPAGVGSAAAGLASAWKESPAHKVAEASGLDFKGFGGSSTGSEGFGGSYGGKFDGGIVGSAAREVQGAAESFGKFAENVGPAFDKWRDETGGAMARGIESAFDAVKSTAGDVYENEVEPALESAGKLYESTVGPVVDKAADLVPDITETAGLALSTKLLNSAMGVAQGTAGQAVSKVGVENVSAADLKSPTQSGVPLPRPVANVAKAAASLARMAAK